MILILEALYEQDFLDCSYGFRPGRSGHQALESLRKRLLEVRGGCVLDIDIRKFFDTMDHGHLHAIVRRRVRDGVLLRLIGKWLKAGVMERKLLRTRAPARHKAGSSRPQQRCEIVPDSRLCDLQNAAPSDLRARMEAPTRVPSKAG
ncbi:MAG: RNA-directed polymerase [Planctomycetota bacterium]|nr:RNA-directed polymerase [Planctomycetota bacterium]